MRLFNVYTLDEEDHQLVLAKTPTQAAGIARTVWEEAGIPESQVKVVELQLTDGDVRLIYEPNTIPVVFPKKFARR